jgi:hypothetical protein
MAGDERAHLTQNSVSELVCRLLATALTNRLQHGGVHQASPHLGKNSHDHEQAANCPGCRECLAGVVLMHSTVQVMAIPAQGLGRRISHPMEAAGNNCYQVKLLATG